MASVDEGAGAGAAASGTSIQLTQDESATAPAAAAAAPASTQRSFVDMAAILEPCCVCFAYKYRPMSLRCGHTLCLSCTKRLRSAKCPLCNSPCPMRGVPNHALMSAWSTLHKLTGDDDEGAEGNRDNSEADAVRLTRQLVLASTIVSEPRQFPSMFPRLVTPPWDEVLRLVAAAPHQAAQCLDIIRLFQNCAESRMLPPTWIGSCQRTVSAVTLLLSRHSAAVERIMRWEGQPAFKCTAFSKLMKLLSVDKVWRAVQKDIAEHFHAPLQRQIQAYLQRGNAGHAGGRAVFTSHQAGTFLSPTPPPSPCPPRRAVVLPSLSSMASAESDEGAEDTDDMGDGSAFEVTGQAITPPAVIAAVIAAHRASGSSASRSILSDLVRSTAVRSTAAEADGLSQAGGWGGHDSEGELDVGDDDV